MVCYPKREDTIKIIPNYYVLQSDNNGNKLLLEKTWLGLFGIQPGIEKYDRQKSVIHMK